MARSFHCPACQTSCAVPDGAVGRKVRCPRCQAVFLAGADAPTEVATAPARRPREAPLIPPRKRKRDESLIPPPPDGTPAGRSPGFVERELRGAVVWMVVMGVTTLVMSGVIGVVFFWFARH